MIYCPFIKSKTNNFISSTKTGISYEVSVAFYLLNWTMKMNRNEMQPLCLWLSEPETTVEPFAYGVAALHDPAAKKLFYMLSVKLSAGCRKVSIAAFTASCVCLKTIYPWRD